MQIVKSREPQIPGNARTRARRATAPQAVRPLLKKSEGNYDCLPTLQKDRQLFTFPGQLGVRTIVVCARTIPRSVIIWTRSRELSLKLRYQVHKGVIS